MKKSTHSSGKPNSDNSSLYFKIINSISDIIYIYETDQRKLVFINNSLKNLIGYTKRDLNRFIKENGQGLIHPEDINFMQQHLVTAKTLKAGNKSRYIVRIKDSEAKWRWIECIESQLVSYNNTKGKFMLGVARDITEHVKSSIYAVNPGEKESENKFRCSICSKLLAVNIPSIPALEIKCPRCNAINSIIGKTDDHIMITDSKGKILFMNDAGEKMTGFKNSEVIGKTPALWGKQMSREFYKKMWDTILKEKKAISLKITNKNKAGNLYQVFLKISPILNSEGEVEYLLGIESKIEVDKK